MEDNSNLIVNESAKSNLVEATKWAKFLCILAAIGAAFMVLAGLGVIAVSAIGGAMADSGLTGGVGVGVGIFYLVFAAIYVIPLMKAFKWISKTREAISDNSSSAFEEASYNLRFVLKFFGILSIAVIILYIVIMIGVVAFGAASAFGTM